MAALSRVENFKNANVGSPVVYGSAIENGVVYRLADGKVFRLTTADARSIGYPRWVHDPC